MRCALVLVPAVLLPLLASSFTVSSGRLELELSDENGAITAIRDTSAGILLSSGSQNGCLFGFTDEIKQFAGGCSFSASAGSFSFKVAPGGDGAELLYTEPSRGGPGSYRVSISKPASSAMPGSSPSSSSADALDLTLTVLTAPTSDGAPFVRLKWPSELVVDANRTSALVLPVMPGLWLGQDAFSTPGKPAPRLPNFAYPGLGMFADMAWLRMASDPISPDGEDPTPRAVDISAAGQPPSTASLSVMGVTTPLPGPGESGRGPRGEEQRGARPGEDAAAPPAARVLATTLNVFPCEGASGAGPSPSAPSHGQWYFDHAFLVNVSTSSPSNVSFTVRLAAALSPAETADEYGAHASGLEGAAPRLPSRLGPEAAWMSSSTLLKIDMDMTARTFGQIVDQVVPALPGGPSLVHPAGYEPGGFDHDYPDLLPPDPRWGSTEAMRGLVDACHAAGHLFMPYTNPTWWDVRSPTVTKELPASGGVLTDITALNASLQPLWECYGPNCGAAVTPASAFVSGRDADLVSQIATDRATAHGPGIGSDAIFCDQIGARPPYPDENPATRALASRHFGPWGDAVGGIAGFARAWQLFSWNSSAIGHVHTEQGFDKLLVAGPSGGAGIAGFHGQQLLQDFLDYGATGAFCPGGGGGTPSPRDPLSGSCWRAVPWAASLLRGLALLYQHDLATKEFDADAQHLAWDAGMGLLQHSMLLGQKPCADPSEPCPWAEAVHTLQRELVGPSQAARVVGFTLGATAAADADTWTTWLATPGDGASTGPFRACNATVFANRATAHPERFSLSLGGTTVFGSVAPAGHAAVVSYAGAQPNPAQGSAPGGPALPWLEASQSVIGGVFAEELNGQALPPGEGHVVLMQLGVSVPGSQCGASKPGAAVWHPFGTPTAISVPSLPQWDSSARLQAQGWQRVASNRTVTWKQCTASAPVAPPGANRTVQVPQASFCSAPTSLVIVC